MQRYYIHFTLQQWSHNVRWPWGPCIRNPASPHGLSRPLPSAGGQQWLARLLCHPDHLKLAIRSPFPLQQLSCPILTFNSEALPVLVSCFNFSEATALVYFPARSGLLFSRSLLRFSFSFIFKCFWYFFFLLSRFLSVAVFSAAVFVSPALFFSYWKTTINTLINLT